VSTLAQSKAMAPLERRDLMEMSDGATPNWAPMAVTVCLRCVVRVVVVMDCQWYWW
jgi:hypothetical protein